MQMEEVDETFLPEEMKNMTLEERAAFVEEKAEEREKIQSQIRKLNDERSEYVAAERAKMAEEAPSNMDRGMIQSIKTKARAKNFVF